MGQPASSQEVFNMVNHYAENLESGRALSVLMPYMDWEHSSQLIEHGKELSESIWQEQIQRKPTPAAIEESMKDYLPVAWELVMKQRREATVEALEHYQVWLYLIGEKALSEAMTSFGDDYGISELLFLSNYFNWNHIEQPVSESLRMVS